ncbi:Sex-determining protein fem-1 [Trichostrongylus colubriformis]|uniref:Sex-determining protein fem-1 n=1 Tax=Trichostrongylus colubriformis TaxID=6319 RepID=A0AAN8IIA1_TRICO
MNGMEFRAVVFNAASAGNLRRLKVFLDGRNSKPWLDSCLNSTESDKIPLVIASRNGHVDVVRYLLAKGADPNVVGTVSFDGETIYGAPALWAASAAGKFEVVRLLVEEAGANINQTTNTSSTPLRGACYDGHLEIVKYLVEHGADIEVANQHGHTSLMIAAYRQKVEVVKYLISCGADVNRSSKKGNTAMHDAVEGENADVCNLLLDAGARLVPDEFGVCPLMCAVMIGADWILPMLLEHSESGEKRRDALKLLGCTRVDKKMDMVGAIEAWNDALKVPLTDEERQHVEEVADSFVVPDVYEGVKEIQTLEDVRAIEDSPDAIRMQALLIRERILGGAHADVHYYLRFRGAVFSDLGYFDKCYELWSHALILQQTHLTPLHLSTQTMFQAFLETFLHTLNDRVVHMDNAGRRNAPPKQEIIAFVFDRVCYELERLAEWGERPLSDLCNCGEDHVHSCDDEKKRVVLLGLQLLALMNRLSLPMHNDDDEDDVVDLCTAADNVKIDVRRLVKACRELKIPLLHLAVKENDFVEYEGIPSHFVVDRLLAAGMCVNSKDADGDTALHVMMKNVHPRMSIIRLLLDYGAYALARDANGDTCVDIIASRAEPLQPYFHPLRIGKYITLKGLAANAVRRNNLAHDGVIPQDLLYFTELH